MAKRFTLLDEPYYQALRRVTLHLQDQGLSFCLVGGGAVQAWTASLRTGDGARRIGEVPELQTDLRHTRDLDFATRCDGGTMMAILNELAAMSGAAAHVLGPRSLKLGPVSVAFTLEPADLSGMADHYDRFLQSRVPLHLRRGTERDEVPAIGLEELIATKLTRRGDKAKDLLDVTRLANALRDANRRVNLDVVRALVAGRADAIALTDELESLIAEERR